MWEERIENGPMLVTNIWESPGSWPRPPPHLAGSRRQVPCGFSLVDHFRTSSCAFVQVVCERTHIPVQMCYESLYVSGAEMCRENRNKFFMGVTDGGA